MQYLRTMKATEFKFQELEFSASRTKSHSSDCVVGSSSATNKKIALRKLSRKSETARRNVINIPTREARRIAIFVFGFDVTSMLCVQARSRSIMHIHDC